MAVLRGVMPTMVILLAVALPAAAATTYHVRTDGSDKDCTGRADTPYAGSGARLPLMARTRTRIAGLPASGCTGRIATPPKPRSKALNTSARASPRQIRLSTPPDFSTRRAA